ncbi:hypothetical protein HELRODRAFT_191489 [Helobdella robusta]|uniref:Uncharacterized protein n=1 Tax=Helobdella robusta TaxID=6412 RepID=T1FT13_HELRO|nr:hypothetical protein HELRODRAFT_191489 [Helobdella robusta]ESO04871.1 hypothetical protein HELRODRAFT_191489 [Helobdella robusta]
MDFQRSMEKQVSFIFTDSQKDRYLVCDNVSRRGYVVSRGNQKSGRAKRMKVDVFISKANKRQHSVDDDGSGAKDVETPRRRWLCARLFTRRRSDRPDTNIARFDSVANLNHVDNATVSATTNDNSNDGNDHRVSGSRKKWRTSLRTFFGITDIDGDDIYGCESSKQKIIVSSKIDESKCILQMVTTV